MHAGWESLYLDGDVAKAKALIHQWYPTQLDPNDFAKTAANGCFTLDCYIKQYGWDKQWRIIANEAMDHTEDNYAVKLDLVVEDAQTGDILGVDHKFSGSYLDYKFFNKFNPNSQVTQYYRYIKEKYGRCDGFVINAVGMRYRQRAYKGEPAGFWCAFERQVLSRTQQQIDQDQESKQYWIDAIELAKSTGIYGMNTDACWRCEYQPICASGWTWNEDQELITNLFTSVCEKYIPETNSHCKLTFGHEGEHDGSLLALVQPVEFQVNI